MNRALLVTGAAILGTFVLSSMGGSSPPRPPAPPPGGGGGGGGGHGGGGGGTVPSGNGGGGGGGGGGAMVGGRAILKRDFPNWTAQPEGQIVQGKWAKCPWWSRDEMTLTKWLPQGELSVGGWVDIEYHPQGGPDRLGLRVSHDVVMLGGDVRLRCSILAAQAVADYFGCLLPTCGIVDAIWNLAAVRIPASPKSATDSDWQSINAWLKHEDRIAKLLAPLRGSNGGLPGGCLSSTAKEYVMHPGLIERPNCCMYGWYQETPTVDDAGHPQPMTVAPDGWAIQSPISGGSLVHEPSYFDYSHGVRVVSQQATLNGEAVSLAEIYAKRPDLVMGARANGRAIPARHPLAGPPLRIGGGVFV